jgi:hypothetical protein
MSYLYHRIPEKLEGTVLYPLNALKEIYPDIYKKEAQKYIGREQITQQRIPALDCLWNDVLHFTAVHPQEVKQALIEAGRTKDFTMSYYQIDPHMLDPKLSIVYLYAHTNKDKSKEPENFEPYNSDDIGKFSIMPQATKDYYKQQIAKGERALLYVRVPHILYKGSLDVSNCPIITV